MDHQWRKKNKNTIDTFQRLNKNFRPNFIQEILSNLINKKKNKQNKYPRN